ncbi:hypothetical protein C2S52_008253 [Perilla frutescens var. hirtella]|nr:hypothetical protein C2S52_008253 [Perilla frutescens var. hirtella]
MAEGAVSFLLEQLSVLLRDKGKLLGGLKHEVQSINNELVNLKQFLRVADGKEENDSNIKEWVGQLREIYFNVEDIASEIKTLNLRLENVVKSQQKYRDKYAIMDQGSSSTLPEAAEYDGRGDALFLEEDEVVGIEKPKKKLLEWIGSKDSGLEVISVVGTGRLGKTTLVKKVFDDASVKSYFDRHVWVTVSDYKDNIKHVLVNLIKKLVEEIKESPPQGLQDMSIDDMRNFIKEFLKGSKYIIVLDDVWKSETWEALSFALPKKGGHGCIVITTRSSTIGNGAYSETDHVYNLQPLSAEESEELFFKKVFPRNSSFPPPHLREFAENILKRCEVLPLAIVVIGGLLATKKNKREEWEMFNRSLSNELMQGGRLERLWKSIFSLSYNDLPYYLKYCFLYLSIFPEGGLLYKGDILLLWIPEGYVQSENDKILEEVAEKYLNDIWSRNLIQVAEKYGDGTVHAFPSSFSTVARWRYGDGNDQRSFEEMHALKSVRVNRSPAGKYEGTKKLDFDDIGQSCGVPYGIGSCLLCLQTLAYLKADRDGSTKIVREIGMLTQLTDLGIDKVRSEHGKDLCTSIANLTNIRKLIIRSIEEGEKLELDYPLSSTGLPFLSSLSLYGCLERVPQWIPSLHVLSTLFLMWCKLREDTLNCIQNLPNLRHLLIHEACVEGLSFKAHGFLKLETLQLYELRMMKWVIVEKGSLPFLQEWIMVGCELLKEWPQGIEHLTNLQDLYFNDMTNEYRERAVDEKRRLARVSKVWFGTFKDGSWSYVAL